MVNERERAELWEGFVDELERLRTDSEAEGAVVVVEGARDRAALRRLGLRAPIVLLHAGRSTSALVHELDRRANRVIVLTDWDRAGGLLAARLREHLRAGQLDCDLECRRRLARLLHGELVHVEGLYRWARRVAESLGSSLEEAIGPAASGGTVR